MVMETYEDTKFPAGTYKFYVQEIGDRVQTANSHYRTWTFKAIVGGTTKEIRQNLFPFMAMPLLSAIGFENTSGKITWDTELALGRQVQATVVYEKDKHDASKEYPRLIDWQAVEQEEQIPF